MAKVLALPVKAPEKFGFERAKKRQKQNPEQHGQMNLFAGKPNSASARILNLPSQFSPFEDALLLDEKGEQTAIDAYLKAIAQGDCIADAYCNLAILKSKSGEKDEAFDCFTKSLKEDPRHMESHYNLANLYFEIGNLRLAAQHYEIAAKIEPGFPNIYFNLGIVHAINEDYKQAVITLGKYKELVSGEEGGKADDLLTSLKRSLALQN